MASKIARKLTTIAQGQVYETAVMLVDKELSPLRETLSGLLDLADVEGVSDSEACDRARALVSLMKEG